MIITIIGSGMMGSAMSIPARDNGHTVRLCGTHLDREIIEEAKKTSYHIKMKRKLPDGIEYYQIEELDKALCGCDFVISGVSSFGVDWFLENVIPKIDDKTSVLSVTKGLIDMPDGSMKTFPHFYMEKIFPRKMNLCAIGGPCTSYELADRHQTEVAFCGENIDVLRILKKALSTSYYHISLSTDIVGVECAVALKNAYALGVSLAIGMGEKIDGEGSPEHYNSQAALFGQSIKEMRQILSLIGGLDDNIIYGAGDLYVTVFGGRTRKIGTLLGRGLLFEEAIKILDGVTLESIVIATRTARSIRNLSKVGKAKSEDFPLLMHVDDLINNNKLLNVPWEAFTSEK